MLHKICLLTVFFIVMFVDLLQAEDPVASEQGKLLPVATLR